MDATSQGNAAIAASIARDSVKSATCRDCGTRRVAWVMSKRTGKPYLADATIVSGGRVLPQKHLPHFKSCNGSREGLRDGSRVLVNGTRGIFEGIEENALGETFLVRQDDGFLCRVQAFQIRVL